MTEIERFEFTDGLGYRMAYTLGILADGLFTVVTDDPDEDALGFFHAEDEARKFVDAMIYDDVMHP